MKGPVRTKNAAATRQNMLEAARTRFLQESYENVGLRDIAGDAGVDVALVSRYFGSKEELFKEVLRYHGKAKMPDDLGTSDIAGRLACLLMEQDGEGNRDGVERLLIILRSASSPNAAALVRDALHEDVLSPIADLLDGDNRDMRASFAVALMLGTKILRTIMAVEPLCQCDDMVPMKLTRLFELALADEPVGGGDRYAVSACS